MDKPILPLLGLIGLLAASCGSGEDLVVRISLDQPFSEGLVKEFEKETGLKVRAQYDIEASKTVGHVRAIIEEAKSRPRTDVFWNNEIAQTIRLAELGLLEAYDSPSAQDIPEQFRDPARTWTGFAARARVLIVNSDLVPEGEGPTGTLDLLDPKWSGKAGIALPLTGTTLTHATALYQVMGEDWASEFFGKVQAANAADTLALPNSNGTSMRKVGAGELAWAWTDTDDYHVAESEKGYPVRRVYPDQVAGPGVLEKDGEPLGTLLIPNTIMLMKDAPHPDAAKKFIDWVLRREIEQRLAESASAQIPVRDDVPRPAHVGKIGDFKVMKVDYAALGKTIADRSLELGKTFNQ
ncbi:Iron-utilization periplasmic protein precursor [Planctomycetes bacterium Poly30]|uniref:Iron-utilization periplasmic protein n=1 Tax=Saltatorellus ferox TaxID=2528018 RepID=A0A518ESL7_9BACT|nr:Iron-utilization periplasmic protein precursor [Planctomycetes bacterium Poly30]